MFGRQEEGWILTPTQSRHPDEDILMSKDPIPRLSTVHHHPDYRGFRPPARDYLWTYWSAVMLKEVSGSLRTEGNEITMT